MTTISAAIPAYQAEAWIGETLESVLGQTSPANEVVVVDDGSTDATSEVVRGFGDRVKLVRQENRGVSAAYNRAFREAGAEFVAMCPADDLWEPNKLELQRAVLAAHSDVDVAFGGARYFGIEDRDYVGPPATGRLEPESFFRQMYDTDLVPAPTAVVRRSLWEELGGFREDLAAEDYEFWLRALKAGAVFFHDPRVLVRLRQHGGNISSQALLMWEMNHQVHAMYGDALGDRRLEDRTLARDLRKVGRCRLGLGDVDGARRAYRDSLSHARHPAGLAWAALLRVPGARGLMSSLAARRRART